MPIRGSVGGGAPKVEEAPPPASIDAEQEVLSSILDSVPAIKGVVATGLQPEHFYLEKHQLIFRGQRAVARGGHHADEIATWAAVQSLGASDTVDRNYLAQLVGQSRAPFNVRTHALRLIELASKRTKIAGARRILEGAKEEEAELSDRLIREGLELVSTDFSVDVEATSPEELADDFFEFLDGEEPAEVFELPWAGLNESVNGGYRRGEVSVLAGWTNVGKSLALDQMLGHFHSQGKSTAIFLTEMTKRQRVARWVTSVTRVPTEKILRKQTTQSQLARVIKVLPDLPFSLFEAQGWDHNKIAERITFGGFDVAAVDHVTRLPGFGKTEIATEAIGRLNEVAVRANLHLILVAQLKKERVERGKPPRPNRYDLRNTSQLAEDAHQILFIHRDSNDRGDFLRKGEVFFDKIRNGPGKGSVEVEFAPLSLGFDPIEKHEQAEMDVGPTHEPPGHDQRRDD
jgi:replicative DNA helicase